MSKPTKPSFQQMLEQELTPTRAEFARLPTWLQKLAKHKPKPALSSHQLRRPL